VAHLTKYRITDHVVGFQHQPDDTYLKSSMPSLLRQAMTRTSIYSFTPSPLDPAPGATIEMDVSQIEHAGIREVLQTPARLRLDVASMIEPLGHYELGQALCSLTRETTPQQLQSAAARARAILDNAPIKEVEKADDIGGLVGGVITRAGPITQAIISTVDQEALARLNLSPAFVGIERSGQRGDR
jgi:hypothetical protein